MCSPTGDILLDSDEDVQALAAINCEVVSGSLEITGPDITSLEGLEGIREVSTRIYIYDTSSLATLRGLDGVEQAGLVVADNIGLVSLDGLSSLRQVNSLMLTGNIGLLSIEALAGASFTGASATISYNEGLTNLHGLEGMIEVEAVTFHNNTGLQSLSGLDNLMNANSLTFTNNPDLAAFVLPGLEEVLSLTATQQPALRQLSAPALQSIEVLMITSNPALAQLDFRSLRTAQTFYVVDNAALVDLGDFSALESVASATVAVNAQLSQCLVDEFARYTSECTCEDNGPCP